MAAYLPNAAMAGILFMVAWGLIDFEEIISTVKYNRQETFVLLSTFLATLFLSLEEAVILGVMLSLGLYLSRTSHPQVKMRVPDPNHKIVNLPLRTMDHNVPSCVWSVLMVPFISVPSPI